jgi:hypothetical protein
MANTYTCRRKTRRWPNVLLFNTLDMCATHAASDLATIKRPSSAIDLPQGACMCFDAGLDTRANCNAASSCSVELCVTLCVELGRCFWPGTTFHLMDKRSSSSPHINSRELAGQFDCASPATCAIHAAVSGQSVVHAIAAPAMTMEDWCVITATIRM